MSIRGEAPLWTFRERRVRWDNVSFLRHQTASAPHWNRWCLTSPTPTASECLLTVFSPWWNTFTGQQSCSCVRGEPADSVWGHSAEGKTRCLRQVSIRWGVYGPWEMLLRGRLAGRVIRCYENKRESLWWPGKIRFIALRQDSRSQWAVDETTGLWPRLDKSGCLKTNSLVT